MKYAQPFRSSTALGAGEEWTEAYIKYVEGTPQPVTTSCAESISRAVGFAGRQADTAKGCDG